MNWDRFTTLTVLFNLFVSFFFKKLLFPLKNFLYCGKIYITLTILNIFKCSVALSAFTLLGSHPHHPPPELSHLPKLKLCPH